MNIFSSLLPSSHSVLPETVCLSWHLYRDGFIGNWNTPTFSEDLFSLSSREGKKALLSIPNLCYEAKGRPSAEMRLKND